MVIKSPGIPETKLIAKARDKGIEVLSEIEFASRFSDGKIVAITGSNGKTTTASLIDYLLKSAGFNVALAGNIGDSFARSLASACLLYTSPSPRDRSLSRMPSSA